MRALMPERTETTRPFWEGCDRGELLLRSCHACGACTYYPRAHCPSCGSDDVTWLPSSGGGSVWSSSEVHMSFRGDFWEPDLPYTVVLVDLDEGARILSRMVPWAPTVAIGDRVHVSFVEVDGHRLPYFEPSGGPA